MKGHLFPVMYYFQPSYTVYDFEVITERHIIPYLPVWKCFVKSLEKPEHHSHTILMYKVFFLYNKMNRN